MNLIRKRGKQDWNAAAVDSAISNYQTLLYLPFHLPLLWKNLLTLLTYLLTYLFYGTSNDFAKYCEVQILKVKQKFNKLLHFNVLIKLICKTF